MHARITRSIHYSPSQCPWYAGQTLLKMYVLFLFWFCNLCLTVRCTHCEWEFVFLIISYTTFITITVNLNRVYQQSITLFSYQIQHKDNRVCEVITGFCTRAIIIGLLKRQIFGWTEGLVNQLRRPPTSTLRNGAPSPAAMLPHMAVFQVITFCFCPLLTFRKCPFCHIPFVLLAFNLSLQHPFHHWSLFFQLSPYDSFVMTIMP